MNPLRPLSRILLPLIALALMVGVAQGQESPATRRLYVATAGGFDLDEAAANAALANGADINWKNDAMGGETMLITAIKGFKEPKVIKFLLAHGANAKLTDDGGKTALAWATQYGIGKKAAGREIIKMLEQAAGAKPDGGKPKAGGQSPAHVGHQGKLAPTRNEAPPKQSTNGALSAATIKAVLEKSFTSAYEDHFFGVKNKVTFEWSGPITIGAQEMALRPARKCYPAKLQVHITITDPRDGNTTTIDRGLKANIAGYHKTEIFLFFKDGFGEWTYGTRDP